MRAKQNFEKFVSPLDAHASGVPAERKNYSAGLHGRIEGVADAPVQRTILRSSHPDFAPNALVDLADLTRAVWRVEQAKISFNAISGHLFAEVLCIHMELRGGVRRKVIGERGPCLVAGKRVDADRRRAQVALHKIAYRANRKGVCRRHRENAGHQHLVSLSVCVWQPDKHDCNRY